MSKLLPPNASPLLDALDEATARIELVPTPARDVYNPDATAPNLLPWLAWAVSVDEWSTSWNEQQKREAVKSSLAVHKYKGTIGALREAVVAMGYSIQIVEWFQQTPAGTPYTFQAIVTITDTGITAAIWQQLIKTIYSTKNLRSHLSGIILDVVNTGRPRIAAAASIGSDILIESGRVLTLDGSWHLDGRYSLDGLRI